MDNKDNDNDKYIDDNSPKNQNDTSSSKLGWKKNKNKRNFLFYLKWIFIVFIVLIFVAGTAGVGIAYSWIKDAPKLTAENFDYIEPTTILDVNGDLYQGLQGKEMRDNISIEDVPDIVKHAFIDIEDERFYEHNGIDIQGLARAGLGVIQNRSLDGPGGSTITQQLIKQTHLSSEKRIERKVVEMYLSMQLERIWTKEQILESYLNKVGFANAWGIQAASQTYFRKDVQDLSVAQAAVLSSIIKSPTYYKPYVTEEVEEGVYANKKDEDGKLHHNEKNKTRALAVVSKMEELGHINKDDSDEATRQLNENDFDLHEPEETQIYTYFTDALYEQILDDLMATEEFNFDQRSDAESYLLNSGLVIESTIDPKVQDVLDEKFQEDGLFPGQSSSARQASQAMSEKLGEEINYMPEGAMTIINNANGHVAGMIGGRNKDTSRALNRATTKYQVGSSTKPLTVYAPGVDSHAFTLGTTYDDVPVVFPQYSNWKPTNAGGGFEGMVTVREGLRKSKNVVAAQAWMDLGLENSIKYAELLGLDIAENDRGPASLALGGYTEGQTTLAMASAFSTFATEGTRAEPVMYTKVLDKDGNVILENQQEQVHVFSPDTAYLITDVLKDSLRGGTTSISVPNMEIAGKTGTTNEQSIAYFGGYTPYYSAAVWYGYDRDKVVVDGQTYNLRIGIYGGSRPAGPAAMFQSVMRELHKELEGRDLPSKPEGTVSANIDTVSGKLPTELSSRDPRGSTVRSEMFLTGTVPTARDDFHVELTICSISGKLATEFCPRDSVKSVVRIIKPDNRFPSGVKPIDPNYIPGAEASVIASRNLAKCDLHHANSAVGLSFLHNNTAVNSITLNIGETTNVQVVGKNSAGETVSNLESLKVESSDPSVTVVSNGNNSFAVTAVSAGKANITATISFKSGDNSVSYSSVLAVIVNGESTESEEPDPETPPGDNGDDNDDGNNNDNGNEGNAPPPDDDSDDNGSDNPDNGTNTE